MIYKNNQATPRQRGFTLVEIMVVIVILGLLATIVAPEVIGYLTKSEEDTARLSLSEIDKAVELYYIEQRKVPELEDLITENEQGRVYLKGFSEVPRDPWGTEYEIRKGENAGSWEVICYGRDTLPDTDDDISSKTLKDRKKN
ncbi:MAG: type II secretion system protein GspG [Planctomycetota bacterium]|jgi:general secretion pathway protein G